MPSLARRQLPETLARLALEQEEAVSSADVACSLVMSRCFLVLSLKNNTVCQDAKTFSLVPEALQLAEEFDPLFVNSDDRDRVIIFARFAQSEIVRPREYR